MTNVFVLWKNGCGNEYSCESTEIVGVFSTEKLAHKFFGNEMEITSVPHIVNEEDGASLRQQMVREKALAKLSHEERKALGL